MRIVFASQEYPPETAKGGIGTQTYLKAQGLAALGHEVQVISRTNGSQKTERLDGAVQVMRIPGFEHRMSVYNEVTDWLTYSTELAATVASLHARKSFDLIDFPEWGCEGYTHLLNRTEWNRIPTVVHLHGPLVMFAHTMHWPNLDSEFYRIGTAMEEACLRLADGVLSSSEYSAEWCRKHYHLKKPIRVLNTGVDTQLFAPGSVAKDARPTIIFVGKVVRNKGVVELVEAGCQLAGKIKNLQVRLIGRGDEKLVKELRKMAAGAGYPELLDFPGALPHDDLPSELSRAHVFAAPSISEGGPGFVYLEAMACGLPVIGCSGSGSAEVFRHGENGFLVPPGDLQSLIEVLQNLLRDQSLATAMGAAGREFVLRQADSRRCLQQLEEYYQEFISRH